MSVRSLRTHNRDELPTTPDYLRPLQQLVLRWGWKMTDRRDVIPTIIPTRLGINIGAPAQFVPATAQVHVPEEAFKYIDAAKIESIDQFIAEHPRLAGRFVHEFMHAAHSPRLAFLQNFQRNYDAEHYEVLSTLLEGHCEQQGWSRLRPIEQQALSAVIFEVVLEDLVADGQDEIDFKSPRTATNLLGLIAARVDSSIIDVTDPKANAVFTSTVAALGEYFSEFWELATRFADQPVGWSTDYEIRMTEIVKEWVELQRSFVEESRKQEEERKREQSESEEEGEGGEGEGDESESEEGEESEEGQGGEDEDEGQDGEGQGQGQGEEEGEGEGQAPGTLGTEEGGMGGSDGAYAHSHQPDMPAFDPSALENAIKSLEEADKDAHDKSQEIARANIQAVHAATATWHAQRRAWNREQARQWR